MVIKALIGNTYILVSHILNKLRLRKYIRRITGSFFGKLAYRATGRSSKPIEIFGHNMLLASRDKYPPISMVSGTYERKTTELIYNTVMPSMVAVDIGAHVGYFSLLLGKLVGRSGKVYSFEPEPDNHSLLRENIRMNGYENIVAINKAVSNVSGFAQLLISGLDNGRNSFYANDLPTVGSVVVETITLDDYMVEQGSPTVDLIKIDVEGSEFIVWQGMTNLLDRCNDLKIIMEMNPSMLITAGVDPISFLGQVADAGFSLYTIDERKGLDILNESKIHEIVSRLCLDERSVNLFCVKE